MKWTQKQFDAALKASPGALPPLVLVYGEDGGTVRRLAKALSLHVAPQLDDPFMVDRISVEDVYETPSALYDSAGTLSFGADVKLVRFEGVSADIPKHHMDAVCKSVSMCLETPQNGAVVVVAAPGVDNKSALAKAVEKSKEAVALRCYHDNTRSLVDVINGFMQERGKKISRDAVMFLKDNLGNDRDITMNELEKIAVYAHAAPEVTLDHCLAVLSSAPSVSVFKLCDALGQRNKAAVNTYLHALAEEGVDMNMTATMVLRHLRRILEVQEAMASGQSADAAMAKLRPPVMQFAKQDFMAQVRAYPSARLKALSERFYTLQLESRLGYVPDDLVYMRGLLGLSA